MFQSFKNILESIRFARILNQELYQDNPITPKELFLWIWNYGSERTLADLKKTWDHHNDYDVETL